MTIRYPLCQYLTRAHFHSHYLNLHCLSNPAWQMQRQVPAPALGLLLAGTRTLAANRCVPLKSVRQWMRSSCHHLDLVRFTLVQPTLLQPISGTNIAAIFGAFFLIIVII